MAVNEHLFELTNKFEYAYKGDTKEAQFITLLAPTYSNLKNFLPIKQIFMRAMAQASKSFAATEEQKEDAQARREQSSQENDSGIEPDDVMKALFASNEDINKLFIYAQELFKDGAALIDGEEKLTDGIIKLKLSVDDFQKMVVTYISVFIAPSLISGD